MAVAVKLLLAGDTALGGTLDCVDASAGTDRVASVREIFAGADLRFLNFDCAIGHHGEPLHPEEYLIDCDVDRLRLLNELGVDVVSLANNHSTDRGLPALQAGIRHLRARGIAAIGAGADAAAAASPWTTQCRGLSLAWFAFASSHPWVGASPAGPGRAGVAALDPEQLLAVVEAWSGRVDAVIISLHWGKEYIPVPPPENVALARRLIDAGARVIVGHHPHVVQPVEVHGAGVICYSLGNFLFPDYPAQGLAFRGSACQSLLVTLRLDRRRAAVESVRLVESDPEARVAPVSEDRAHRLTEDLSRLAGVLGQTEGERLWHTAVRRHEWARLRRVLRREVLDAGWRAGTARLLRLGGKNLRSVSRSLSEILGGGR